MDFFVKYHKLFLMEQSKSLLRTNPSLSGNLKITINNDKIYFNSIDANVSLSDSSFKDYLINTENILSNDIYFFWNRRKIPSNFIFQTKRELSDYKVLKEFKGQFETQYNYGVERCTSKIIEEKFKIFAPIWSTNNFPKYFVIFKNKGAKNFVYDKNPVLEKNINYKFYSQEDNSYIEYNNIKYYDNQNFIAIENINTYVISGSGYFLINDENYELEQNELEKTLNRSDILKVYDLSENTNIGRYFRNYLNQNNFVEKSIDIDFNKKEITYNGISIDTGLLTQKVELINFDLLTVLEFDEYITQGFERNNIISQNLLNLEFTFDDNDYNTFNRYFGMYCDDLDMSNFELDNEKMFKFEYPNLQLFNNKLNENYNKKILDSQGIKVLYNDLTKSGTILDNNLISEKNSIFYIKDCFDNFLKVKKDVNQLRLKNTEINLNQFYNFEIQTELKSELIGSGLNSLAFEIDSEFILGQKINLIGRDGITKFQVIADHLPIYPEPYGEGLNAFFYFYPYGNKENIAKAIAKAFNFTFKIDKDLIATAVKNKVVISERFNSPNLKGLYLEDNNTNITIFNQYLEGGTKSKHSRIKVEYNLPNEIKVGTFIKTQFGFSKIESITSYIEEPINKEKLIDTYKDLNNFKIITIEDKLSPITIKNGNSFFFKLKNLNFGLFSFYDVCDFDFSILYSDYNKNYNNEYKKYYKTDEDGLITNSSGYIDFFIVNKGVLGDYFFIDIFDYTNYIFLAVITLTEPVIQSKLLIIQEITRQINLNSFGYTAEYLDDYRIRIYLPNYIAQVNVPLIALGGVISGSIIVSQNAPVGYHIAEKYKVFSADLNQSVILHDGVFYGTGSTWNGNPITDLFTANNNNFTVVFGNPIVINVKYINDEELLDFVGFNSLDYKENNQIENPIERKFEKLVTLDKNEYDLFSEKKLKNNLLKNKVVPNINKWVYLGGKDIRDNEYRLNISDVFTEFNFSPSFIDEFQKPEFFTHEWFYLSSLPENILDKDISLTTSYFDKKFNYLELKNKFKDYFKDYFTVDKLRNVDTFYQERYSIIKKELDDYVVFFRGVKLKFSNGKDYENWKFSCVLNINKTVQDDTTEPFKIKIIENEDYKNITLLIEINLDDYKINPYNFSINSEYSYLYMMKNLRRWDNTLQNYLYGIIFDYPIIPASGFIQNKFDGVKLSQKIAFLFNQDNNTLEYKNSIIPFKYTFKENNSLDFGTLFGYNITDQTAMFTSGNQSLLPSTYDLDLSDKRISTVRDNFVKLKPSGIFITSISSFGVHNSFTVASANSAYPMNKLNWFQIGGGKNFYIDLSKYLSFSSISDLIKSNNFNLVEKILLKDNQFTSNNSLKVEFIIQNEVNLKKEVQVNEKFITLNSSVTTKEYSQELIDLNYTKKLYRYNGSYIPKIRNVLSFKDFKVKKFWKCYSESWKNLNGVSWNDEFFKKISISDLKRGITSNIELDKNIKDFKLIPYSHHKKSDSEILSIIGENYPDINEIAIDEKTIDITSNSFDNNLLYDYQDKVKFNRVNGVNSLHEFKNFFGSTLYNIENIFKITISEFLEFLETDTEILFKIDLKNQIILKYFNDLRLELDKYCKKENVIINSDYNEFLKNFITENFYQNYFVNSIDIYKKQHNISLPTINTEENDLILLRNNYLQEKINDIKIEDDILILNVKKQKEYKLSLNIKIQFKIK